MEKVNKLTEKEMVTIPVEEYEELLDDSKELRALYEVGVNNWRYFSKAMRLAHPVNK